MCLHSPVARRSPVGRHSPIERHSPVEQYSPVERLSLDDLSHVLAFLAEDHATLCNVSLTRKAWTITAQRLILRRIMLPVRRLHPVDPSIVVKDITFKQRYEELKHTPIACSFARELVVCGPSLHIGAKYMTRRIVTELPLLTSCALRRFLERFPYLHTLRILNVVWRDCTLPPGLDDHQCWATFPKFKKLNITLYTVQDYGEQSSIFSVLQSAMTIDRLELNNLNSLNPVLPPATIVDKLVIIRSHARGDPINGTIPLYAPSRMTSLEMDRITYHDLVFFRELTSMQLDSLVSLSLTVTYFGNTKPPGWAIDIGRLTRLTHVSFELAVPEPYPRAAKRVARDLLDIFTELPSTIQDIRLTFTMVSSYLCHPLCVLTAESWTRVLEPLLRLDALQSLSMIFTRDKHIALITLDSYFPRVVYTKELEPCVSSLKVKGVKVNVEQHYVT